MTRSALALFALLAGCASVSSTFTTAHHDSLATRAATDLSCSKDQLTVTAGVNDVWNAQGCGKSATYQLLNPNCLVERDCNWQAQPAQ